MANQDINDIIDIFGVNVSSDNEQTIDLETSDSVIQSRDKGNYTNESFDDKLKEAQEKIVESKIDVKSLIDISMVKKEDANKNLLAGSPITVKFKSDIPMEKQEIKKEIIAELVKEEETEPIKEGDPLIEESDDKSEEKTTKVYPVHFNDGTYWNLTHSNPKFEQFYEYKKNLISNCLVDGELLFPKLLNEFKEQTNDISAELYDLPELYKKMDKIIQSKTFVLHIGMQVHMQYFMFERGIELLRGVLSKFEHLKPVQKQDGVIYEHMSDMELYFAKLKAFHKIVEGVLSNLDSAYFCLHSKVTSSAPLQNIDRKGTGAKYLADYSDKANKPAVKEKVVNENLDGFDPLSIDNSTPICIPNKKEVKTTEGTKEIGW